jgi:hypothetical protein
VSQKLQDLLHDQANQRALVQTILTTPQIYSPEESSLIADKLSLFKLFVKDAGNPNNDAILSTVKKVQLDTLLTKASLVYKRGESHAIGYATTIILASPEEILSSFWDLLSREKARADTLERSVDEAPNDHNQLFYLRLKSKWPLVEDREWLTRYIWKRLDDGSLVRVSVAVESGPIPRGSNQDTSTFLKRLVSPTNTDAYSVVRARTEGALRIRRISDTASKLEVVVLNDFGGALPPGITNFFMAGHLSHASQTQRNFQSLRRLAVWGAEDGRIIGDALVITGSKADKEAHVREMFDRYAGLQDAAKKYEFFLAMVIQVVRNKLRIATSVGIERGSSMRTSFRTSIILSASKKLTAALSSTSAQRIMPQLSAASAPGTAASSVHTLSTVDAKSIGGSLSMSLATNATSQAAVNEWMGKYPAMKELSEEEPWFEPMMQVISNKLLRSVSWGMKFRLFAGAGVSITDMVSDLSVIVIYFQIDAQRGYAWMLLGLVLLSLFLQMCTVVLQNRRATWGVLTKEVLIVLSCTKPGVDAARIAASNEMEAWHVMDPQIEQTVMKVIEMLAESSE